MMPDNGDPGFISLVIPLNLTSFRQEHLHRDRYTNQVEDKKSGKG